MMKLKRTIAVLPFLLLLPWLVFSSGCTKKIQSISAPNGNAEGYSGNRPLKGNYYLFDSRAVCASNPAVSGYRAVVEVTDDKIFYRNPCDGTSVEASLDDFLPSEFGTPVLSYKGEVYGYSAVPPTAGSTDLIFPRARSTSSGVGVRYDVIVRSSGTTEVPVNARAQVVKFAVNSPGRVLGEVSVTAVNVSATERRYQGADFRLIHRKVGATIVGELQATIDGDIISQTGMTSSDTYLSGGVGGTTKPPGDYSSLKLSAGDRYACRIQAGAVYCWGHGDMGQLGDGGNNTRQEPFKVGSFSRATKIVTGFTHSCAIEDGGLWCWGSNDKGELGFTPSSMPFTPRKVNELDEVTDVAVGSHFTCAVSRKKAYCWGNNAKGNLGIGNTTDKSVPQLIADLTSDVLAVSAAVNHACAIDDANRLYCWGDNSQGQLGVGSTIPFPSPVRVQPVDPATQTVVSFSAVAASLGNATCAISTAGKAYCWGSNAVGESSADGIIGGRLTEAREITSFTQRNAPVTAISHGGTHACAIQQGLVYCWGPNSEGEMGQGYPDATEYYPAYQVPGLNAATAIACGIKSNLALSAEGATGWGMNNFGQLGRGEGLPTYSPTLFNPFAP